MAGPREERVAMTRIRQRIAEHLKQAQNTAAMLTTFNEVDMSAVIALRKQYGDEYPERHGVRLGFMSFFVKAAIVALREIPEVNAGNRRNGHCLQKPLRHRRCRGHAPGLGGAGGPITLTK